MIIGTKTTGYPVPGIKIGNRRLFLEVLEIDNEAEVHRAAAYVERALKEWADMKPGVNFTKEANVNPLRKEIIQ